MHSIPAPRTDASGSPAQARFFNRVLAATRSQWIPIRADGRANSATGILVTKRGGYRADLLSDVRSGVAAVRLRVSLGQLRTDATSVTALLKLQTRSRFARLVIDPEDGHGWLEAAGYLTETCNPQPLISALVCAIRAFLSDDRISVILETRHAS